MNRRIRSSDWCAAASDSSRAWKAVSIWLSMMFSDRPRLPISVRGSRSGTRRFRWPSAMSSAVSSISTSGRRFARTTATPTIVRTNRMTSAHDQVGAGQAADRRVDVAEVGADDQRAVTCWVPPRRWSAGSETGWVITRQVSLPDWAGTVTSFPSFALAQASDVGTAGSDWGDWSRPSCRSRTVRRGG